MLPRVSQSSGVRRYWLAARFGVAKSALLKVNSGLFQAVAAVPQQRMVEPEVVATSPNRIKSPVPVCCGFSSKESDR
jgi:hypothetical protein